VTNRIIGPLVVASAAVTHSLASEPQPDILWIDKNRSQPGSPRPYKDFNYASFTGWALETALAACGETVDFEE
jgi:hypothetical protein